MTDAAPIDALRLSDPRSAAHVDLEALRSTDLPPSYRAFVAHAGWGRLFGLWLVYPPVLAGYADGLRGRGGELTRRFRAAYAEARDEEFDWMVEPDGSWDLAAGLEVFGWSENGDALLWQTDAVDARGEFPVWEARSLNSLHRLGDDLTTALPALRARALSLRPDPGFDVEPLHGIRV